MAGIFIHYLMNPYNNLKVLWAQLLSFKARGSGLLSQYVQKVVLLPQWVWRAENQAQEDFSQTLRSDGSFAL